MSPFGCCVLVFLFGMTKKEKEISVVTPAVTFFQNSVTDQVKTCFFTQFFLPDSTKDRLCFFVVVMRSNYVGKR